MNNLQTKTLAKTNDMRKEAWVFVLMTIGTISFWQFDFGQVLMYPFTILSTWFHEMAHGLAALLLGGDFDKLVIMPNGSGAAYFTTDLYLGSIGTAIVAAAGPIGPGVFGSFLILVSKNKSARTVMVIFSLFMFASVLIWIRSWFGGIFIAMFSLILLFITIKASDIWLRRISTFMGIQAIISVYQSLGYLYSTSSDYVSFSGKTDTEVIQSIFLLPYWFWATAIVLLNILIFYYSIRKVYFEVYE